jgi:hypothetical protein
MDTCMYCKRTIWRTSQGWEDNDGNVRCAIGEDVHAPVDDPNDSVV